jgi:putative hydrolase of the HAD superfamily
MNEPAHRTFATMPHAVLFDLDGTLADRDAAVRALVEDQHHTFARELLHVPPAAYVERFLALDAHGHADKTAVYERLTEVFGLRREMAAVLETDFWANYSAHARLFPDALSVLHGLHARGLKLGLVTNGSVTAQEPVIARLGLATVLDVILVSEREGVRKPQPEIFARALGALGVLPAEAWFVGDHPTVDIEAAAGAGLTAVWRRNSCWPVPTGSYHAIDTLNELLALVDR